MVVRRAAFSILLVARPITSVNRHGRLVDAEIGCQTGEAMAEHIGRDAGWQITLLDDPQPHLAIGDDRCLARLPILGWG
jgi:hypothetical protein